MKKNFHQTVRNLYLTKCCNAFCKWFIQTYPTLDEQLEELNKFIVEFICGAESKSYIKIQINDINIDNGNFSVDMKVESNN